MNASKENAEQAKRDFLDIVESSPSLLTPFHKQVQFVSEFISVARRKLPTEATFAKDKVRVRRKKSDVAHLNHGG